MEKQKKNEANKKMFVKNNEKISEAKRIIKEQKRKIKLEKQNIRRKKISKFKKTKFGRVFCKIFFLFNEERNSYSFSELFGVTIVSLVLGFFVCFSVFMILSGGRNYFKISKQMDKFYDVYDVITSNYYGDVSEDKLIEAAINGMVSSVGDVYTSYNNVETTDEFEQMVNGTYEGIGCTIIQMEDKISVVDVYKNSPASKAGIKENDIIKSVDGKSAIELGTEKLANYIKFEAKGKIELVIIREENEKKITLERGKVEMPTVNSRIITKNEKKIGYVDISIFSSITAKQFKEALKDLEEDDIDSLVIDVRDNNGGYLSSVTEIASSLLPRGRAIYQIQTGDKKTVTKDKTIEKREYPIAILINGGSASASEILAAAIKESYEGYVVGMTSFGKGTVQQVKKLKDGSMIKYTVENWLTPDGNWINEKGIKPTHEVLLGEEYSNNPNDETDNQLQKALELVSQ